MRADEIVHRRLHAALLVGYAGERKSHFRRRQRTEQHRIVDVAEVTDAKHLAREATEARAEGYIEGIERQCAECVGVNTLRGQHRGYGRGIVLRILADDLETPGAHGPPRCLGEPVM